MSDAPLSRGKFLRSLGSSLTGMALGSGVAVAQVIAARLSGTAATTRVVPPSNEKTTKEPDPFINRFSPEDIRIALTFDDGPRAGTTDRILDELKQRQVLATFFMIGQQVEAEPDLARRVAAEGHEVANHTFTHPKLNTLPDQQAALEIQQTQEIIERVVNQRPTSFRPPYLAFRKNQAHLAHERGLRIICGDVSSGDWAQPGEAKIADAIFSKTTAGSIIICHDNSPQTANCIGSILDQFLERGFKFGTVSSFLPPSQVIS
jgi:peptidoglycan/xylan/chitin deacetylase (PgdA/CDA1 family)